MDKAKLILVFLLWSLYSLSGVKADHNNDSVIMIPTLTGMKPVGLGEVLADQAKAFVRDFNVSFYLFTHRNPQTPQVLGTNDTKSLKDSNFNPDFPTRFICHGWRANNKSELNILIRQNYLARGCFNVIVMDWSEAADDLNYILSSYRTEPAGKKLANFIKFLVKNAGLDTNNTYLIGHSLGAHVVGIAGKQLQEKKINTIFGLDAALPLFPYGADSKRLAIGDGQYVETIHTDGKIFGRLKPIGNASFYPNYGNNQPGCTGLFTTCSHKRSWMYFAESLEIPNEFFAYQCSSYFGIPFGFCVKTGQSAFMGGEPSNYGRNVAGIYYLPVHASYPYAVGV
ncbi:unnamed protein product [Hermetia illucens]|uniref:Lipase domain-containing protein n=1 Tax=Hermetia illucens TaxID=343691 RepID=A0A7R8UG47_HERIL|nr:pancreatic lipase-related protein 2-like [Hermetia illucens]CAD7080186.1 unnamed protein product [Hermetia illucens]